MSRAASAVVAAWACLLAASEVKAEVNLSTELSARRIEMGDRFMLRLKAMGDGSEPLTSPELKVPAGIAVSGPSIGSQQQMSLANGRMTQSIGISATWTLTPSRPGKFRIGPASVQTSAGRKVDQTVTVEVVPAGSLGQAPPPLAGQPFDPLGLLRGFGRSPAFPGFPGLVEEAPEAPPVVPEEYRLERAPDPLAFLRARALPRKVVVGEQVTLAVYAYGGRGEYDAAIASEPSRNDFIAFSLMDGTRQPQAYAMDIEGKRFITVKVAEFALFPVKAGKLKAGAMNFGFAGRAYSGNNPLGLARSSAAIDIRVVEPPLEGRPPGYRIGDVGRYTLSARIEPRNVEAGGSVAVVAKLEGTGNLPYSLLVPEQHGVRWLEPQLIDQVGPRAGVVQGFRTFTYVVELEQPGAVDLGELSLPYYDPKARAYGVARAALGTIQVTGSAKPRDPSRGASSVAKLRQLVTPPRALTASAAPAPAYLTSSRAFWGLFLALPLSALAGFALSDAAGFMRRKLRARQASLTNAVAEALLQLAVAVDQKDVVLAAGAAERALLSAIARATSLRARGLLRSELASALQAAGVPAELATETARQLARCDELRFAGESADLLALAEEARTTCQKLGSLAPAKPEAVNA